MPRTDQQGGLPRTRFGHSRAERIALGLPMHEAPPRSRMDRVRRSDSRGDILCLIHNRRVAVLTDTRLITRVRDVPYPDESNNVMAPCPDCTASSGRIWVIDVHELRRVKRVLNSAAATARRAGEPTRGVPSINVVEVLPAWLREEWSSSL